MTAPRVAIVSKDPAVRLVAARAFDDAPVSWDVALHTEIPEEADVVVCGPDVEPKPGGLVLDLQDPGSTRAEVEARIRGGRGLVVTAPGGGAGATTIALHLAAAMARRASVCLLDLDRAWGARFRLGIGDDALTWADASDDHGSLMRAALPVPGGFRALLSPGDGTLPGPALLERARDAFECVVMDASGDEALQAAARVTRGGVLVVTPSLPHAQRARRVLEGHPNFPWAVVTNKLGPGGEATRGDLERALGRRIALALPCAPALRDAEDDGRLMTAPWSRWGIGVARLARALSDV